MNIKKIAFLTASLLVFGAANAKNWQLKDPELNFITTKITADGTNVTEIGTFADVSGHLTEKGLLEINISPLSVRTGIDIRDERLGEWVFLSQNYPQISLTGQINIDDLKDVDEGEKTVLTTDLEIKIRDHIEKIPTRVIVIGDEDDGFYVTLQRPIILNTSTFGLDDGIAQLVEVAKLEKIIRQIPVTFNGHFVEE